MEELEPSELGTHEYWNHRYETEIANYSAHGDAGEIWFGDDTVERILRWICKTPEIAKDSSIIDLGCGNGMFLIDLSNEGYSNLLGVDYSEKAVELSRNIATAKGYNITYKQADILDDLEGTYKVIHDKGTYDAISLSENAKENRQKYIVNVKNIMNKDSFFIITSCNWTQSELVEHFKEHFQLHQVVPTPTFKFGGKEGSVVSICIFKRI
ncbi:unnamed protein product [Acanthoscelides obtectus]|uniref:Protein-lysine N-methyltransferase ACAOBT_LOCUS4420 n=1 Tax=Acanthoscelides obtectus TaxID=200917 RepID=A0A9P0JWM6_ACAOB|nr:unnamed protein product [Acanthoscelides obtectus]CAK1653024.1 EEF1A lysine methyltransferase 2 [Acanthoscelides obtectus]